MGLWTTDDGAALSFERLGSGPPVFLVHGGFTDSRGLEGLATALASSRTVVRYDRRGRGASSPYLDGHSLDRDIADLVGLVSELADEPVVLVGHSAGCHVALGAALGGDTVGGLLLYEPPTFGHPKMDEDTRERLEAAAAAGDRALALQILLNDVIGRSTGMRVPADAMPAVLQDPVGRRMLDCVLVAPTEQRAYEAHEWSDQTLGGLDIPTLGVIGGESPPFNRVFVDRLAQLSAAVQIRVLPDAGHGLPEAEPDRLAPLVLQL
jgi:pimeloyl-ACP methyl ester carboxylesterase